MTDFWKTIRRLLPSRPYYRKPVFPIHCANDSPVLMISQNLLKNSRPIGLTLPAAALCFVLLLSLLGGCFQPFGSLRTKNYPVILSPIRAIQVDLDYLFDTDPVQQTANLDLLTQRVKDLGINTVFLQAFADPEGKGVAESLYFPNRFMPLRGDLFAPAAQALRQNGVAVYGWLPLLAFKLSGQDTDMYVLESNEAGPATQMPDDYLRLSPFNPRAREIIEGIYRDFSHRTAIDGILFHDDGKLSDFEDGSAAALHHYSQAGFPADIKAIHNDHLTLRRWSRYKTRYLIDFTLSLLDIVRQQQPNIYSARNLYASTVLQPESEMWLAQSLDLFLHAYDYIALMAMPFLENAKDPDLWLERLAWATLDRTENTNRVIFELQSKDWQTDEPVPEHELREQITLLAQLGVTSFAYYPDDFHNDSPPAAMIRSCLADPVPCAGEKTP